MSLENLDLKPCFGHIFWIFLIGMFSDLIISFLISVKRFLFFEFWVYIFSNLIKTVEQKLNWFFCFRVILSSMH